MIKRLVFACVVLVALASTAHAGPLVYSYTGDTFHFVEGVYTQDVDRITGYFVLSGSFVPPATPFILVDVSASVLSYSFTDGHQTLTKANSVGSFKVGFNPDGTPVVPGSAGFTGWWSFGITTPTSGLMAMLVNGSEASSTAWIGAPQASGIITCTPGPLCFDNPLISTALINNQFQDDQLGGGPGTWTVQEAKVPEPGTLALMGIGLAVAAVRRRGKRS